MNGLKIVFLMSQRVIAHRGGCGCHGFSVVNSCIIASLCVLHKAHVSFPRHTCSFSTLRGVCSSRVLTDLFVCVWLCICLSIHDHTLFFILPFGIFAF